MAFQGANARPEYVQHTVAGGNPNTDPLLTPALFPSGTILLDQTTDTVWVLRRIAGVAAWISTSAGGSPPIGPAGGDLSGTYPNPTVIDLSIPGAAAGSVLYATAATNWSPLAPGVSGRVLTSGGAGAPSWTEITGLPAGVAQGDLLYYNGTAWVRLAAGTSGNVLSTQSTGGPPQWIASSAIPAGTAQGQILYWNGSAWVTLDPGFEGRVLQTQGGSANPQWADFGGIRTLSTTTVGTVSASVTGATVIPGTAATLFAQVSGVQTSGAQVGASASYVKVASYVNNGAGSVLVNGSVSNLVTIESAAPSAAGWTCDLTAAGSVEVTAGGVGGADVVQWKINVMLVTSGP